MDSLETINTLAFLTDTYTIILRRINQLSFKNVGFSEGDKLAQAAIQRDKQEIEFLLTLKEQLSKHYKDLEIEAETRFENNRPVSL